MLFSLSCCVANSGLAQTWMPTGAPTNLEWQCVACSADGVKQIAAGNDTGIWVSTNSGSSWAITSAPTTNDLLGVASSADGTRLAAVDNFYGFIYTSADSGNTWTQANVPNLAWYTISMSADGTKLVASARQYIYTSADAGVNWVSNNISVGAIFAASSADGNRLVAACGNVIIISTNAGATWQTVASGVPLLWSAACSASGSTLVVGGEKFFLVSTNSGATWRSNSITGGIPVVSSCVSSADGSRLAAAAVYVDRGIVSSSIIFASTNSGSTWTKTSAPFKDWADIASSADGFLLLGAAFPAGLSGPPANIGGIYSSQSPPTPSMNIMRQESNVTLSWTVPSMNFVIQQSPDLQNWVDMTNQPVLDFSNLQDEVVLPLQSGCLFYRLKTP